MPSHLKLTSCQLIEAVAGMTSGLESLLETLWPFIEVGF
jgi:hypothetical protein